MDKKCKKEKVGYKNPPKEHQFKEGKSGNPKGRPKGSTKIRSSDEYRNILLKVAEEPVKLILNGTTIEVPFVEALHRSNFMSTIKGNVQMNKLLISTLEKAYKENDGQLLELKTLQYYLREEILNKTHEDYEGKNYSLRDVYAVLMNITRILEE